MPRRPRVPIVFAMLVLGSVAPAGAQVEAVAPAPLTVAQRVADHYLAGVEPKLHYGDLLTLYALERLAEVAGRPDYDAFVDRALRRLIALPRAKASRLSFENYRMGGLAGVYRCVQGRYPGDTQLLAKHVRQLVDEHPRNRHGVFCHPREPGEKIWVDCLMAVCPFLSMAAVKLQEPKLHDESIAQYVGMEKALFDEKLGLFHQVENFGRPGVSIDTWGRGNGWALIGLAELIRWLPEDHPQRGAMIARLQRLAAALEPLQAKSGMWRENLVTPDAYEETSGTGLILYAVAMGLREKWLPQRFGPMAARAWQGLAATVDAQGTIRGTCIGTRGNTDSPLEFWLARPTCTDDVHAFGPVLLAAVEMELLARQRLAERSRS